MLNIKCIPGLNITLREIFAIAFFVLVLGFYQFVLPNLFIPQTDNQKIYIDLGIKFTLLVIIVLGLYGKFLKESFVKLGNYKILKLIGVAIVGVISLHVLLYLIRMGMNYLNIGHFLNTSNAILPEDVSSNPPLVDNQEPLGENTENPGFTMSYIEVFAALSPLFMAFVEEMVFRHAFLHKFKNNKYILTFMVIISSILFGLIHYYNFGEDIIQTIPYMFMGLFFAMIYIFTKNVWYNIIIHFTFNAFATFIPAILLFMFVRFGIVI